MSAGLATDSIQNPIYIYIYIFFFCFQKEVSNAAPPPPPRSPGSPERSKGSRRRELLQRFAFRPDEVKEYLASRIGVRVSSSVHLSANEDFFLQLSPEPQAHAERRADGVFAKAELIALTSHLGSSSVWGA